MVLIRSRPDDPPNGILEVVFRDEAGEQVARNVSPFNVEPGKFTYRLVRGELEYPQLGHRRGALPPAPRRPDDDRPPDDAGPAGLTPARA